MNFPNPFSSSSSEGLTREQLVERIRAGTKDEVILEEMQRLGFWPDDKEKPTPEATLIRREAELSQALQELGRELHAVQDPVAALKAMRKERMARARARREETRQKRAQERFDKASNWHQRRQRELLYLGAGVSAGLGEAQSDAGKLARHELPLINDAGELAQAMGLSLAELRFLAFERRVSRISHYRRFAMPKKTGGERIISAPMPRLKRAQYWILDNLLARPALHPAAHGFVAGRSIVSNALPHAGQAVVINLDLKDFFPSIGMPRIKGLFRQLGYSGQVAAVLALLCTESPAEEVVVDGERFFVATGARALPQGAPTSPALTNLLCRRLDARLQACAAKLGFTYTRYADDLTFSGDAAAGKLAGKMLWRAKQIVMDEGFTPHPDKQHVMRASHRQEVTGIVVNQKPAIERDTLRRFRATLYQVEKDGPQGKHWNGNEDVLAALEGYAQFIRMVDADKGLPLLQRVRAAREKWQGQGGGKNVASARARRGRAGKQLPCAVRTGQGAAGRLVAARTAAGAGAGADRAAKGAGKARKRASRRTAPAQAADEQPRRRDVQDDRETEPVRDAQAQQGSAMPWVAYILQFAMVWVLASGMKRPGLLIGGCILIVLSIRQRRARWPAFLFYLALIMGLLWLLR